MGIKGAKKWGPRIWKKIHTKALRFPKKPTRSDKHKFRRWYEHIADEIPCPKCRGHYERKLHGFDDGSRSRMFRWTVKLHNGVDRKLHKKTFSVSEAKKRWS